MADVATVPEPSQHCMGSALAQDPPHMQVPKSAPQPASGHGSLRKGGTVPVQLARPCRTAGARWCPARASGCPAPSQSSACAPPLPGPARMIVPASALLQSLLPLEREPGTAAAPHADEHAVSQRSLSRVCLFEAQLVARPHQTNSKQHGTRSSRHSLQAPWASLSKPNGLSVTFDHLAASQPGNSLSGQWDTIPLVCWWSAA